MKLKRFSKYMLIMITIALIQLGAILYLLHHSNESKEYRGEMVSSHNLEDQKINYDIKGNYFVARNKQDMINAKKVRTLSHQSQNLKDEKSNLPQVGLIVTPDSKGSGTLIDDNKILTATHVVSKPDLTLHKPFSLKVYMKPNENKNIYNQSHIKVKKVEQYKNTELTVLTLNQKIKDIKPLKMATSEPKRYSIIKNVGYHGSSSSFKSQSTTEGHYLYGRHDISHKRQYVMFGHTHLYHGMSGGPTLNANNEIIGINSFMYNKHDIGGFVKAKGLKY